MKLTAQLRLHSCLFLLVWPGLLVAQSTQNSHLPGLPTAADSAAATSKNPDLFGREDPLTFTLTARMQRIVTDRTKPKTDSLAVKHPALLTYYDQTKGESTALPLSLIVRGNFRRNANNCDFPPLYLDFPKKKTKNTQFAKQNKLKLVTHCQAEDYVVREYLIYKLYNQLTNLSFRARLARVSYVDSLRKRPTETRWGFLIEDEDDVAKRNKLVEVKQGIETGAADSLSMARLAVFEFMIGNIDWSSVYRHNIRILSGPGYTKPVVVPYDFDHAALVDAPYAQALEPDNTTGVPERYYRGPLYPGWLLKKVFTEFNTLKPTFYGLYESEKRLNRAYVKQTLKFLDAFYALINDPAAVKSNFFNGDEKGRLFSSFH
ncbi:hypothetical protein [Fibrivirga algicola]|uniref:Uncharacterized protein n=1 Tax=Fibrivirga algicola TaxID=2950420 RepID=A0ABX0QJF3_9BACT|nr:hypothetical protein [Fibrivirga algicola]ARK12382.1 hypothetical protein A6C57_19715 [Fibrella sp. ES10-3-2-2]NID10773.1 hypothetical protein [Fibrivirga algicola]